MFIPYEKSNFRCFDKLFEFSFVRVSERKGLIVENDKLFYNLEPHIFVNKFIYVLKVGRIQFFKLSMMLLFHLVVKTKNIGS